MIKNTVRAFSVVLVTLLAGLEASAVAQSLPVGWGTTDVGAVGAAGPPTEI